jgi:hypothetical protein
VQLLPPELLSPDRSEPPEAAPGAGNDLSLGDTLVTGGPRAKKKAGTEGEKTLAVPASLLAGCRGLEPLSFGVTGRRYNQLN